ncbi:helix-turn-helix domain-containing protein [Alkalibacterium thalassium]|uniref:DNA-binding transcriptional regulator, XRE-family HTH domain n=1 Tax=Alkalibacterium thalassium TaxID=426701 RepID=A0A1G8VT23_9LACT|nr:helix-turn-helix transcriptional regulator [Alkalibacterium thalassium]SDJ69194.1 DNA-binding transcriptional regulator, XRE-family HTH domain [Alkalibacterium thalassium]
MSILKHEREKLNKTQKEVADETGISYSMIQLMEQGRRNPSDKNKVKLAMYYGKSVEYLFFNGTITNSD